jgi:hypothetical protein
MSKVGSEESIVNAPLVILWSKNTNNANSELRFKQLIRDLSSVVRSQSTLTGNLNEHPILHNVDYLKQMGLSICLHYLYSKWRSKTYTCELNCVYVKTLVMALCKEVLFK